MKLANFLSCVFLAILLGGTASVLHAQPYAAEMAAFKKQDSLHTPPSHPILLIGSSSFTKWKDVQSYFPSYTILNRGFGGSTLPDQIRHAEQVIFPYDPKQIIVYCGENDMASNAVTPAIVLDRFKTLFTLIRSKLPKVPIVFISMKPSPSRELIQGKIREGNELIRAYLKTQKKASYIDVYKEMIDDEGKPVKDLFVDDNLHMNRKGYAIWQKLMEPHLMK